jgi:hypothetical protein
MRRVKEAVMVPRRRALNLLTLAGGLSAVAAPARAQSGSRDARSPDERLDDIVKAVQSVREEVTRQSSFWEITPVRDQLRTFLRLNGKFPDFVEVGADVWQQIYDWHVRFQLPITIGRSADGRYTIPLMATTVILRTDSAPLYIGTPYDGR